ncbi:helix-turn-helix transcriptional regulator [Acaryochloris sp. CCMEE 5410]|uniref:helix-turn-helix transcriptional regulator n=1 Tax=Acaryochloris sp. CCMEE 5410 TaxID=310037 RepID=UPI0002484510|nr:helix-turn-helix transcriptional regulator [Acaryochloris sp. CCMEE 5410]KAI9130572.1 helix-turn-helix transcriptional regulator [Acaryochloris sp. CCMEE 5410]
MAINPSAAPDYTPRLIELMQRSGFKSFAELSRTSGLSRAHINWIRQGRILDLRLQKVLLLSEVLQVELEVLLATFSQNDSVIIRRLQSPAGENQLVSVNLRRDSDLSAQKHEELQQKMVQLQQEYQRQQQQLQTQKEYLLVEYQKSTIQALEPLLLQWPTAAYAARKNPDAPAVKLLPLLSPLEKLLASWGVSPIGEVGAETTYDPQWHQVMSMTGQPLKLGDPVRFRYVGYRQGKQLLYRAKVSPV